MKPKSPFGLDGLADLGRRGGIAMRPALLRVLTDLYVQRLRHTPEEERHYTELALRLLEAVDVATRVAVADRLARHISPPPRVLQYLADDVPEVAAVLQSQPFSRSNPVGQTPHPQPAISSGEGIAEEGCRFVEQPRAVDPARAAELNEQFFAADAHERRLILLNLDIVAPIPVWLVGVSRDPMVSRQLEAAALARNREDFARHLAAALQVPREQARRIVNDDLGEPVAVAGKVLAVPRDVLHRILMFINPAIGHSVERVHSLAVLFDAIPVAAAAGMVAIWQALSRGERAAVRYQPVTWDEARPRARPAVTARTAAATRPSERRSAS